MKQETENRQQRPQMICLCATCANAFYNVPTIRIQRVDRYQLVKDTCTYCGVLVNRHATIQEMRRGYEQERCLCNQNSLCTIHGK